MSDLICPVCNKSIWRITRHENSDGVITHYACSYDYERQLRARQEAAPSKSSQAPVSGSTEVEKSGVALFLAIFACLELIASPIAGFAVGSEQSAYLGWVIFLSGFVSGLILLGFARVIEHLYESAQRLCRIEFAIQKARDGKDAA